MSPSSPAPLSEQAEPLNIESVRPPNLAPAQVPHGLVPAGQLPSAADVLAQLFPSEDGETSKDEKFAASSAAMFLEENSFPYASPLSVSLPPFDPYSLTAEEEAPVADPAVSLGPSPSLQTTGSDLELHSLDNEVDSGQHIEGSGAPKQEATGAAANANEAIPEGSHGHEQRNKKRKRGAKTSFRRLATGFRKFLKSKNRGKEIRPTAGIDMQAPAFGAFSTTAESAQPAADAAANIDAAEPATARSATGDLARSDAPEAPEVFGSSASIHPANESPDKNPASAAEISPISEAQKVEESAADSLDLPAKNGNAGPTIDLSAPDLPHDFFSREASRKSAQEPPQDETTDEQSNPAVAEEEVDSSDDDHAIATAIERYANTSAAAAAEAESIANAGIQRADFLPDTPAVPQETGNHLDINSLLGIPRDSDAAENGVAAEHLIAGLAESTLAGGEAFALSESTIWSAQTTEPPAIEPPVESTASQGVLENTSATRLAAIPYRDWSFEEKIASHHEWIESKGTVGKKADLTASDLEGSDLIGVDLRFVDLHDANLRAADLLMADLRDACLVRANFRDSCLVGANLEAANLESASLETAMGLVPRQLAGANLHEATLPPALQFEALPEFKRTARQVHGYFVALLSMCALSALLIWMTKDFQLLTNSAVLFFLHSSAAAAALPTVQFYLIAPMALFVLYLVLQFHLQHLWDLALELPAVFPDGHTLGENEPRIVLGLLRAHFRWMNADAPSTRFVEKTISMLLAYWVVPLTLLFYWARFLTLQQLRGTTLHSLLIAAAVGVALYSSTKVGKPAERWIQEQTLLDRIGAKLRGFNPVTPPLVLLGVLVYLAIGTIMGIPHSKERAPQFMAGSVRRWAPSVLWAFGIDPYADLTEATISKKPANWNGSDEQVASVSGAHLNGANFRYAQAYRAFLANAHLLHANLQGAFLSQADLRSAEMGQSNLKYAVLDQAQMNHVNLDRATLTGANLSRADLRSANLSYASMGGATLVDAHLDSATLYGARLNQATLIRTNFEKADLRESHLEGANLEHVDMRGAYLWSAKLMGASLTNADLQKAIFVDADLHGADLRWAHLDGTVLTGADLTGAYLDGADLRGAVGFGANQICAAKSRHGLLLDDAMQMQVAAQCGAGN